MTVARVMKNLAANGIVKEIGSDQYCGTPFSRSMNEPAFGGGLVYFSEALIPIFWGIPEFLAKTDYQSPNDETKGPCQYALKTEKQFFDLFQENTHLAKGFNALMDGYSRTRPRWVDFYPLERLGAQAKDGPFLVDIGGGLGGEITDFHNRCPDVSGQLVLQDIPAIISEVQSSSKLPSAIKPVVHDFFQPQPPEYRGARAYFIRLVLHDWTDSRCHLILSHLRDAMIPGWSKLLINENCLSDAGTDWRHTSLDWVMMALFASRARTESQWRALLSSAGLKVTGIWHKEVASESVIEAVRMDEVTNEICSTTFGLDRNCR